MLLLSSKKENMKRVILAVIIIPAVLFIGCDSKEDGQSIPEELLLYCGAGIRPPVDELVETFGRENGLKIALDYAGSEVLLSKIKLLRRGDLYMPGDKHYVEQAAQADMILSQRSVCYWVPTILVRKGNPKEIRRLEDLLKSGIKLGLGDPEACAIGRTSKKILEKNNIKWEDIQNNLRYKSLTVNELGIQIQAQALDAVIVWDATAKYYSEHGDEIPIAIENNIISTVDIGVLKFTKHQELADKFVDFVTSEKGKAILKKHYYSIEPPE
jgi:molybdate transport system substrate-binding protein